MRSFYLIGFRGAGKTTIGRQLARELGLKFLDLDDLWEKRNARTIVSFVEEFGIESFRRQEAALLGEIENGSVGQVIATGGGIVEWGPSVAILLASPLRKIYLEVSARELWNRLREDEERKKIGDLRSFEQVEALLEKRRPIYEKIATFRADNRVITDTLAKLKELVKEP